MKSILLVFALFASAYTYSQDYQCSFRVQNVETYPVAKELISIIRNEYNTESNPRSVSVKFNAETQEFNVISEAALSQATITALMGEYSYTIAGFKSSVVTPKENEIHE